MDSDFMFSQQPAGNKTPSDKNDLVDLVDKIVKGLLLLVEKDYPKAFSPEDTADLSPKELEDIRNDLFKLKYGNYPHIFGAKLLSNLRTSRQTREQENG